MRRREFEDVLVLDETMRQGKDEAALLARLLAIRQGSTTQAHWAAMHERLAARLSAEERTRIAGLRAVDAFEIWAPCHVMNRQRLCDVRRHQHMHSTHTSMCTQVPSHPQMGTASVDLCVMLWCSAR